MKLGARGRFERVRRGEAPDRTGAHAAAWLLSAASALAFLAAAAFRRLNFDEPLALRAGFLSLSGVPGEPGFAMPFTILTGALGLAVEDPGHLFLAARLLVAGGVLLILAGAFRSAARGTGVAASALFLTLASSAFFVHGLEFRYDAAILVLLVLSLPLLTDGSPRALLSLGVVTGLLATHHLKGLYVAAAVAVFAALRGGLRGVPRVAAGVAAAAGGWVLVASALGILPDVVGLYASFLDVALEAERWSLFRALGGAFRRDAAWWGVAAGGVGGTLFVLRARPPERLRESPDLWALALAAASGSFLFVHPRPFAYMLALPVPFLGFLVARRIAQAGPGARASAGLLAAFLVVLQTVLGPELLSAHVSSFRASRAPQVEALRFLRRASSPGERVLDPSGLAYFLPPCTPQWYVDSVFENRIASGTWMANLRAPVLEACPWMVITHRLDMLPADLRQALPRSYLPVRPGIALLRSDGRWAGPGARGPVAREGLESFW